jgi:hypothetical protein
MTENTQDIVDLAEREMHAPRQSLAEREKARLRDVAKRLVHLILRDRDSVFGEIENENKNIIQSAVKNAALGTALLLLASEEMAQRLWDRWTDEERSDITVEAGYCLLNPKSWFRISGAPERVEEPKWYYIVDPRPVGIVLYDREERAAPRVLVVEPMSPMLIIYTAIKGQLRPAQDLGR